MLSLSVAVVLTGHTVTAPAVDPAFHNPVDISDRIVVEVLGGTAQGGIHEGLADNHLEAEERIEDHMARLVVMRPVAASEVVDESCRFVLFRLLPQEAEDTLLVVEGIGNRRDRADPSSMDHLAGPGMTLRYKRPRSRI